MIYNDWLLIVAVVGYTIVDIVLIIMVAPVADSILDDVRGFFNTLDWLGKHLTGG